MGGWGYGSEEVWRKMVEDAVDNLIKWAAGGR